MSADWFDTGWTCYDRNGYRLEVARWRDGSYTWKAEACRANPPGKSFHNDGVSYSDMVTAQRSAVAWADTQSRNRREMVEGHRA